MFKIVRRKELNPTVILMDIEAPLIAKKAKADSLAIFRVDEFSERIPLTIAGTDIEAGLVTIVFQIAGGEHIFYLKNKRENILVILLYSRSSL